MINPLISIISPVYGAENIVDELVKQIVENVSLISANYEIILVDDCGPDNSWQKIENNCNLNTKVKGIKLSRNFGQHYAITAGIEHAKGDYIIVMDCDLQDDPKSIYPIIGKLKEGFDVVFTKREKRSHSFIKKKMSELYNTTIALVGDKKYDIDGGSMLGASKKACEAYLTFKEKDRLYIQIFKWVGFKQCYLVVPHNQRHSGESSYTFVKMLALAIQGVTSHSTKLLKLSIYAGFTIALLAFLVGITIIVLYFTMGFSPGWPSIFVGLAFTTGLVLLSNGVLGIYIGKTFEQAKNRPLYIVDKKHNIN